MLKKGVEGSQHTHNYDKQNVYFFHKVQITQWLICF
jgi:hypothetical protein